MKLDDPVIKIIKRKDAQQVKYCKAIRNRIKREIHAYFGDNYQKVE